MFVMIYMCIWNNVFNFRVFFMFSCWWVVDWNSFCFYLFVLSMINFIVYEYYVIVYLVVNYSIINCDFRDVRIDVGIMICLNCNR